MNIASHSTPLIKALSLFCCSVFFDQAFAISNTGLDSPFSRGYLKSIKQSLKDVTSHSFTLQNNLEPRSFGLNAFRTGQISFSEGVQRLIKSQLYNTPVKMTPNASFKLTSMGNIESVSYTFSVNGVKVCNSYLSAFRFQDNSSYIIGQVPEVNPYTTSIDSDSWPSLDLVYSLVNTHIESDTLDHAIKNESKCFFVKDGDLVPAWDFVLTVQSSPYHVIAGEYDVFLFEPYFFDGVEGSARVYKKNPIDAVKVDVSLDLTGDGTLTSDHFTTSPIGVDRAESSTHEFNYEKEDDKFAEVSVFAHATSHLAWFFKNGYEWAESGPMDLIIHGAIQGDINNSQYKPGVAMPSKLPMIQICDGDGQVLKDLPYDTDVVSHELGHHIVFTTVKTTSGESLVLHEGLSDYFVFARTEDGCLADSICPPGAPACVSDTCLRIAAEPDELSYGTDIFSKIGAHHKGQAISGLLYRLRTGGDVPPELVDEIAVKSTIDFLQTNSGYRHLFLGLLNADKALSGGKYACAITEAAIDYGFESFVKDINCETVGTTLIPKPADEPNSLSTTAKSSSSSNKDSPFGCSVQSHAQGDSNFSSNLINGLIFLLAAILPLVIVRRPKKVRVRVTSSSRRPSETYR